MSKITDKQLTAKPTDKDVWLSEVAIWGHGSLVARITPRGERLFYFRYSNSNNIRITLPIGTYSRTQEKGTMSLADAGTFAKHLAGLHKSGIRDIKEHLEMEELLKQTTRNTEIALLEKQQAEAITEKEKLESRMTVRQLFERWMTLEIANRKDAGAEVRRMFEKDVLPHIGQLFAEEVHKRHIAEITDRLLARGVTRMAKVVFSLIRQMFNFAVERDIVQFNPTSTINKGRVFGKDNERDRILSDEEIIVLKQKLNDAGLLPKTNIVLWIVLSTCCRIGELLSAKWTHIDFEKRTWLIPSENSKNGKPLVVFLSDFSKRHFKELHNHTGNSVWCYPNRDDSDAVSQKTVTKQIGDRQKAKGELPINGRTSLVDALILSGGRWTPHDLRRTGASIMTRLKVLPEVAERCLNHTEVSKVKRTYQRYDYADEMTEAWKVLGLHLESLLNITSD